MRRIQPSFPSLIAKPAIGERTNRYTVSSYLDTVFHGLPNNNPFHADTNLLAAAAKGDLIEVNLLIDQKADVNTLDYDKRTALHLACCENHKAVVKVLLAHNADVNTKDRWQHRPLDGVISQTVADLLLNAGAVGSDDALISAAAEGDLKGVQKLIQCKASIDAVDYDMRTALHVSATRGHLGVVQFLIANGADITLLDRRRRSAIADAIEEGHYAVEQAFRRAGAPGAIPSMYCPGEVTVLLMDIKSFTTSCSALCAREVGEWISIFYSLVDAAAGPLGVRKAEVRGDCCICVTGGMESAPCGRLRSEASSSDQVSRMLEFACTVHASFLDASPRPINARMGMAFGEVAFLFGGEAGGFCSIQGDVVNVAARMESHAVPGTIMVHVSAVDRWMDEVCGEPPTYTSVECKGKGAQIVAVYSCINRAFVADAGNKL